MRKNKQKKTKLNRQNKIRKTRTNEKQAGIERNGHRTNKKQPEARINKNKFEKQ